jgi:hypothetical protein
MEWVMKTITVIARPGCVCPRENPREPLITDSEAVTVPDTTYYTRLIADGSLLKVKPNEQKKKKGDIADKSGDDK